MRNVWHRFDAAPVGRVHFLLIGFNYLNSFGEKHEISKLSNMRWHQNKTVELQQTLICCLIGELGKFNRISINN